MSLANGPSHMHVIAVHPTRCPKWPSAAHKTEGFRRRGSGQVPKQLVAAKNVANTGWGPIQYGCSGGSGSNSVWNRQIAKECERVLSRSGRKMRGIWRRRSWTGDTRQPQVLGAREQHKIDMNKKRTCQSVTISTLSC